MSETPATPSITPAVTPATAPTPELIDITDFMKIQLRVAKILACEPVVKSNKLLKLQLDCGPTLGQRQIVSGIAKFYTPEQLIGKKIVIIANLKPAKLAGELSEGMLLAASDEPVTKLVILDPGVDMPEGAVVR